MTVDPGALRATKSEGTARLSSAVPSVCGGRRVTLWVISPSSAGAPQRADGPMDDRDRPESKDGRVHLAVVICTEVRGTMLLKWGPPQIIICGGYPTWRLRTA